MEEDIKILEEFIEAIKFVEERTLYELEAKERCKKRYKAIENLLTRYKQLEEENKKWEEWAENAECDMSVNYIRKSKIKEKIEELEHEKFKRTQLGVFLLKNYENQKLLAKIQVLQELLEEE